MPHYTEYKCGECKQTTLRELLVVKKVVFTGIGAGAPTIKSRTIGWLCNECLPLDKDFQLEKFEAAPGTKSPALERVRKIKGEK